MTTAASLASRTVPGTGFAGPMPFRTLPTAISPPKGASARKESTGREHPAARRHAGIEGEEYDSERFFPKNEEADDAHKEETKSVELARPQSSSLDQGFSFPSKDRPEDDGGASEESSVTNGSLGKKRSNPADTSTSGITSVHMGFSDGSFSSNSHTIIQDAGHASRSTKSPSSPGLQHHFVRDSPSPSAGFGVAHERDQTFPFNSPTQTTASPSIEIEGNHKGPPALTAPLTHTLTSPRHRVVEDETQDPTEEQITEYAKWLGMDMNEDVDLLWIARKGLMAPLHPDWKAYKAQDSVGGLYFFNAKTGASTWEHPSDVEYEELYRSEKRKKRQRFKSSNSLSSSARAHHRQPSPQQQYPRPTLRAAVEEEEEEEEPSREEAEWTAPPDEGHPELSEDFTDVDGPESFAALKREMEDLRAEVLEIRQQSIATQAQIRSLHLSERGEQPTSSRSGRERHRAASSSSSIAEELERVQRQLRETILAKDAIEARAKALLDAEHRRACKLEKELTRMNRKVEELLATRAPLPQKPSRGRR